MNARRGFFFLSLIAFVSAALAGFACASELDPWVGTYAFEDDLGDGYFWEYRIIIYKDDADYRAEISVDGRQVMLRLLARVVGDGNSVQLVFDRYLPDNSFDVYRPGQLLLALEWRDSTLLTKWGRLSSALEDGIVGVYFEKVAPADPQQTTLSASGDALDEMGLRIVDSIPHKLGKPLPEELYSGSFSGQYKWLIVPSDMLSGEWGINEGVYVFDQAGAFLGGVNGGWGFTPDVIQPAGLPLLSVYSYGQTDIYSLPDLTHLASLVTMEDVDFLGKRGVLFTASELDLMGREEGTGYSTPRSIHYYDYALKKAIPVLTGNGLCDYRLASNWSDGFTFAVEKIRAPAIGDWTRAPDFSGFSRECFETILPAEVRNADPSPFAKTFIGAHYDDTEGLSMWPTVYMQDFNSMMYFGISVGEVMFDMKQEGERWVGTLNEANGRFEFINEVFARGDTLFHVTPVPGKIDLLGRATAFDMTYPQEVREYINSQDGHEWLREGFSRTGVRYVTEAADEVVPLETVRRAFEEE